MSSITLIVLARVIHIMAGVIWAGAAFMLAMIIVPIAARYGAEGFDRWTGVIARKVGPASGIAALVTVLSGVYLFASLHPHDHSASGVVLMAGAVAAVLSLATGFFLGRPAGRKLFELREQGPKSGAPSPELLQRLAALRNRVVLSSRATAALLGVAVLAMAAFRYVQTAI